MKYGTTKTSKVHIFTDNNECICDLNIEIDKPVTKEWLEFHGKDIVCKTCNSILLNKPFVKGYIHDLK